jgi:predicted  nucleic acid-binding Zn-ribbon protein
MARVVARQKQIPYLLIVFVFLFVISAALAVMAYMDKDTLTQRIAELEDMTNALASQSQLSDDTTDLPEKLEEYRNSVRAGNRDKTVVSQYQEELRTLAGALNGSTNFDDAMAAYDALADLANTPDVRLSPDDNERLAALIQPQASLMTNVEALHTEVADRMQELNRTNNGYQARLRDLNSQNAQLLTARAAEEQRVREADNRLQLLLAGRDDEAARAYQQLEEQYNAEVNTNRQLRRELSRLNAGLQSANGDIRELEHQVDDLTLRLANAYREGFHEGQVINPDGTILSVEGDTCYISLGADDGVIPDLVFSVYSGPDTEQEGPKARIVVRRVGEESSECVILESVTTNPVAEGDVIADIAFDPDRTWTFVVVGNFDLSGGDNPTARGAQQVRYLINDFGGEVVDEVSINTDFVVLGEEPELPFEPAEDAQPIEIRIYNNQLQAYEEYQAVRNEALRLNLRILNANRFLERLGYIPRQTLTYDED